MGPKLNIHQFSDFILDFSSLLIREALHGILGFGQPAFEVCVNLCPRTQYCRSYVIVRRAQEVTRDGGWRFAVNNFVMGDLGAEVLQSIIGPFC